MIGGLVDLSLVGRVSDAAFYKAQNFHCACCGYVEFSRSFLSEYGETQAMNSGEQKAQFSGTARLLHNLSGADRIIAEYGEVTGSSLIAKHLQRGGHSIPPFGVRVALRVMRALKDPSIDIPLNQERLEAEAGEAAKQLLEKLSPPERAVQHQ